MHNQRLQRDKLAILLACFCLLAFISLVMIYNDDDLFNPDDISLVSLQCNGLIFGANDEITLIKFIKESISLFLVNKDLHLTRAPPV
jgi:hypothetical protein